jgi:hypothetical protein
MAARMTSALETLIEPGLDPLFWPNLRVAQPSAWHGHVPFAHWLVAAMRPRRIVELGTHAGVSFAAFCQGVQRLGLGAPCVAVDTWEGDAHAGAYDEAVYRDLAGFVAALFPDIARLQRSTFDAALGAVADGSVDLLHIDGFHTYEAVRHDFETWRPKLSARGVVLFHDIAVRERGFGVWRFWQEITADLPHFAFAHAFGLGVLAVGPEVPPAVAALCAAPASLADGVRARFAASGQAEERAHATLAAARQAPPDPEPGVLPAGDPDAAVATVFLSERFIGPPQLAALRLPRQALARGPEGCSVWVVTADGGDWRHGVVQVRRSGHAVQLAFPAFANADRAYFHVFVTSPVAAGEMLPAALAERLGQRWLPILLGTLHVAVALPNRPPRALFLLDGTDVVPDNRERAPA